MARIEFLGRRVALLRSKERIAKRANWPGVAVNQTQEYRAPKLNRKFLLTHLREPASQSNEWRLTVKFLYATAFALFSVTATVASPAQSLDPLLLSALCSDDYYEDTAGQCGSAAPPGALPEVLTVEAIIEKYGVIVTCDPNDDSVIALLADPDESLSVGSTYPRRESPTAENAIVTEDETGTDPSIEPATIASPVVTETQLGKSDEGADDVAITGPTTAHMPVAGAGPPADDKRTIE
jgi:hypothetical protein